MNEYHQFPPIPRCGVPLQTGAYNYGCTRLEISPASGTPRIATSITFKSTSDLALAVTLELLDLRLAELIRLRQVSRTWKRVIETLCSKRTYLKLFAWDYKNSEPDVLMSPLRAANGPSTLEPLSRCLFLARLFPDITSLGVFTYERYMANVFLTLLPKWANNLERLSISGLPKTKSLETKLLNAIKALPKLKHLSLFGLSDNLTPATLPKRLPVLPKLESFFLAGYQGDVMPYLVQLGPSIKRLFVDSDHQASLTVEPLIKFLGVNLTVGSALEFLHLNVAPDHALEFYQLICLHFTSIRVLDISFLFGLSLDETLPSLANLPHLYKITFNPDFQKGPYTTLNDLSPFTSVRQLYLGSVAPSTYSVDDFKQSIGRLFPGLEELRIASFSPLFVGQLKAQVRGIFPQLKKRKIGLANRSKLQVGVQIDEDSGPVELPTVKVAPAIDQVSGEVLEGKAVLEDYGPDFEIKRNCIHCGGWTPRNQSHCIHCILHGRFEP